MKGSIAFIFVFLLYSYLFAAPTGQEPAKECALCHFSWMEVFMFEHKDTDIASFPKKRVVATERICFSCHDGTVVDSRLRVWTEDKHKVGIIPSKEVSVPKEFPLEDGKIQCKTCHTAHGTGEPEKEGYERSIFLRIDNKNSELCKACHINKVGRNNHPSSKMNMLINNDFFSAGGVLGVDNQVICESCHTPHGPKEKKLLLGKYVDSELCSYCHTDKLTPGKFYKKGLLNHPVNIEFTDDKKIEKLKLKGAYFSNNREIVCLTCHNTHKGVNKNLLIMNNRNDELCLNCHEDKRYIYYTKHNLKKMKNFKNRFGKSPFEHGVCSVCHDPHGWALKLPETDDDLLSKACFSCHLDKNIVKNKVIDKQKYNHPVYVKTKFDTSLPVFGKTVAYFSEFYFDTKKREYITCATCHNSHIKSKNFLREDVKNSSLCLDCHKDKNSVVNSSHGKNDLNCLSCHKVHNSKNKNLLIDKVDNICLDCHKSGGVAEKKLVGKNSHPVDILPKIKIPKDMKLVNGKIECITCHEPHKAGTKNKFLRTDPKNLDIFCYKCHGDKQEIIDSEHDFRDSKQSELCSNCHVPHNAKNTKFLFSKEIAENNANSFCIICHEKNGIAKEKVVVMIHPIGEVKTKKDILNELTCISCHDPHKNGNRRKSESVFNNSFLKFNAKKFCITCHKDKSGFVNSPHNIKNFENIRRVKSLIKESDFCGFCHGVHFNKNKNVTSQNVLDICIECHKKKNVVDEKLITTSHPFVNLHKEKYKGMLLFNEKIHCATCHNPHSEYKNMLVEGIQKSDKLCIRCHDDKKYVFYSEHNLNNIFSRKLNFVCGECHKAHNYPEGNRLLWPKEKKDDEMIKEICLSCHSESGVAKKKIVKYFGHPKIPMTFKYKSNDVLPIYNEEGEKDINGAITCATCHNAHSWSEKEEYRYSSKNSEGNALTSFLKYRNVINLCNTCHGIEGLLRYKYYHTNKYRKIKEEKKLRKRGFLDILIGK
ncbi:hypothetical protein FHQ18_02925 [Deferribacter autotrophicus]|uniref:Doubled CXXCH motif domain-containing protein n=1 Tax=Deferribacter autotrophicus TaxID=500465 RepID=A0A5A8F5X0_9BACT|nr:cytochrome c3 family protein [Deferribacter autotrophicus]KAA0258915.1 hypothetical protein FHQ18_02925 [Deferribacter autotrophicus]